MSSEQALRRDVALANRVIERFGLSNAFGHVSARIPGANNTFYISTRRSPGLADENDLLVIDTDGKVLEGKGTPNSEFWIHARIYAARPDVGAVVHAHPPACISLTQLGEPHRVVHNQGAAFTDLPEYGRIGLIRSRELGDEVARSLGGGVAVMMRGHGISTAFKDVRAATVAACFLEESAQLNLGMLAAAGGDGRRIRAFTREEASLANDQTGPAARAADRAWEYYAAVAGQRPLGG